MTTKSERSEVSPLIQRRLLELERKKQELQARQAVQDPYYWLTQCTKTKDEQAADKGLDPYRPFPNWPLVRVVIAMIEHEKRLMIRKSRTVMMSWTVAGWAAHKAFTTPATSVVFQSEDEDRAVNDVRYAKTLWENSIPPLQAAWPLSKPLDKQTYNRLELANGSVLTGIVGNPLKINSLHPTIYIADEAALMTRWMDAYGSAVATKCPYLICNSSAYPGDYQNFIEPAEPCAWPAEVLERLNVRN